MYIHTRCRSYLKKKALSPTGAHYDFVKVETKVVLNHSIDGMGLKTCVLQMRTWGHGQQLMSAGNVSFFRRGIFFCQLLHLLGLYLAFLYLLCIWKDKKATTMHLSLWIDKEGGFKQRNSPDVQGERSRSDWESRQGTHTKARLSHRRFELVQIDKATETGQRTNWISNPYIRKSREENLASIRSISAAESQENQTFVIHPSVLPMLNGKFNWPLPDLQAMYVRTYISVCVCVCVCKCGHGFPLLSYVWRRGE